MFGAGFVVVVGNQDGGGGRHRSCSGCLIWLVMRHAYHGRCWWWWPLVVNVCCGWWSPWVTMVMWCRWVGVVGITDDGALVPTTFYHKTQATACTVICSLLRFFMK